MIIYCGCKSTNGGAMQGAAFQNTTYGPGKRVCNPLPEEKDKPLKYRCTVCGAVHTTAQTGVAIDN